MALAVVAILQGAAAAETTARDEAKIDRIYNMLVQAPKSTQAPAYDPTPAPSVQPAQRPGRNDPCWCGSGLKFKRCHGR